MFALYVIGGIVLFFVLLKLLSRSKKYPYVQPVPPSVTAVMAAAALPQPERKTVSITATIPENLRTDAQNKVHAINALRMACPQHDLLGAKYILEHLPQPIAANLSAADAEAVKHQLEAVGLTISIT